MNLPPFTKPSAREKPGYVWRRARARMLRSFDRQFQRGIDSYGKPLEPTVAGLDMADEAMDEHVDRAVYIEALRVEIDDLRAEVAWLRSLWEARQRMVDGA